MANIRTLKRPDELIKRRLPFAFPTAYSSETKPTLFVRYHPQSIPLSQVLHAANYL